MKVAIYTIANQFSVVFSINTTYLALTYIDSLERENFKGHTKEYLFTLILPTSTWRLQ